MLFDVNRFHIFVLFTWQFAIFFASQQIFPIFSNYIPQWSCDGGLPTKDCEVLRGCKANITFPDKAFNSAALEFEWYCGDTSYLTSLFSQIQFAGVLIGTFSFGTASDAFGRKPIAIFALTLGLVMSFASGAAPSWQVLLVLRFFVGLSVGGTLVVVCTFVMEMLLPQQRMALRAFFNWGVARLMMTVICYAFNEWRMASYVCALTALPALLILIFVFPESPTWLHNKGRWEEMRKAEQHIAKFAGIEYKPVKHKKIEKSKTLCELLQGGLLKRLSVLWFMWFTAAVCGYATDLNSNNISGDFFLNQVLFSILIAVSKMVLVAFDTYFPSFSRRALHQGSQAIVCLCFLALLVMTLSGYHGVVFLITNLLGTVFIEYTWDACYLCAVESMETSCRASATGTCSLVARIGAIIAPFLAYLNTMWPPAVYLTVVVLGSVNLVVSYVALVETKGVNLDNVTVDHDPQEEVPMMEEEQEARH